MIQTGFETRVKIQEVIENQLPEFILTESPKTVDFLKQYYISQEFQGGVVDIAENLDQYLKLDNLTPEVINNFSTLSYDIDSSVGIITVSSTKGYPSNYGLLKIDDEIITYTGVTTNTFTGCIRGFSGITTYSKDSSLGDLVFSSSKKNSHKKNAKVTNLSTLFLKEFYKKIKYSLTPGLENYNFVSNLNVANFIKQAKSFYQAKGTDESFKILFNILYGIDPKIVNLEDYLIKPSAAEFIRREVLLTELISGENPALLRGQTIRKSTDLKTQASVSGVEILTRKGNPYYKISLFIGYGDNEVIDGIFSIPGKTKVVESIKLNSSVITVDSTIGFEKSGSLICQGKTITYKDKTINQFLNCDDGSGNGITFQINVGSDIRSDEVIFGYENGNLNKKVELRITGVLNEFVAKSDIYSGIEGEKIYVKNLGEKITNPEQNKSFKQLFANSLVYNTSVRYQVSEISGSVFTTRDQINKLNLKEGDIIEILSRNTNIVVFDNAKIKTINNLSNQILIDNLIGFHPQNNLKYDIRKKIKKASSLYVPIEYGNDSITADVQNFYNENDEYFYVASNSLPSYQITKQKYEAAIPQASSTYIQGFDLSTLKYSIISFEEQVPFLTGDSVYYYAESKPLFGLESGKRYYVEVLSNSNQIRLYLSRSFISYNNYLEFYLEENSGSHTFSLFEQAGKILASQKLLRKFPSSQNIFNGTKQKTTPGSTGLLVNGVEIINYKSKDEIYYGPIDSISVISSGSGYDVVNPPLIELIDSNAEEQALVQPVVKGKLVEVLVDPQDFDINRVTSVTISGGNNVGARLDPVIEKDFREVSFNGKLISYSGGIDVTDETITFLTNHNFVDGQAIVYDKNENDPIGVGTFGGSNRDQNIFLISGGVYYSKIVNNRTIKLFANYSDYSNGINTVGFTTINTQGIHKFRVFDGKNVLKRINVIDSGTDFENRILKIKYYHVDPVFSTINFKNHGFKDGDLVVYNASGTSISGLTLGTKYYIIKITDDSFQLCNSGGDGSYKDDYFNKNYIKISVSDTTSNYYHIFKYPDIQVLVDVEYSSTVGVITATPIIKGSIVDAYLYEKGKGYGSNILNFHKKPIVDIKRGKNAQIKPIVRNGRIINFEIQSSGSNYTSDPDIVVKGSGIGAILRPIVKNGKIANLIIINSGINYDTKDTTIEVIPRGSGALLDCQVRNLKLNNFNRHGIEILNPKKNNLQYTWVGYSTSYAKDIFNDSGLNHSPIIGWAYDGNPIYGPYGFSDPNDLNSSLINVKSGYELKYENVENRPDLSLFPAGFFVDDFSFTGKGNLDESNGRFCKTPEFPNGIYAYFATIKKDSRTNSYVSDFPYFIGNYYRSPFIEENKYLNQDFDFNNSSLTRNTYPYNISEPFSGSDSLIESNEITNQFAIIESVNDGFIDSLTVKESGDEYSVGDIAVFDNENTDGGGLSAYVNEIYGKEIDSINTSIENYNNSTLIKISGNEILVSTGSTHNLKSEDVINLSNLSVDLPFLANNFPVKVPTGVTYIYKDVQPNNTIGVVTDISVSYIPEIISVDSVLGIGTELVTVLNVYNNDNILRVKRGISGTSHTTSDPIVLIPNTFTIQVKVGNFNSKLDEKIFFNSQQSIGIGTTVGMTNSVLYAIGDSVKTVSIPNQSIYLPNHPFRDNQLVTFKKSSTASPIAVSTSPSGSPFYIMGVGNAENLYVINKSKDYIGLTTSVDLTTNTGGLFFIDNGSNSYEYCIESNYDQITSDIKKITTVVSVASSHGLRNGDTVTLNVIPNQSIGISSDIDISLLRNNEYQKTLINYVGINSLGISTSLDKFNIPSHGFITGDKVFYSSSDEVASGLTTGGYFVYKIDDDNIKLSENYSDLFLSTPKFIDVVSIGGTTQKLSLINPPITVIKNNNLIFKLDNSSLVNYKLKIFYDKEMKNEFVSTGNTNTFSISGFGTPGITPDAYVRLNYSEDLPSKLYYGLEKGGFISTSDTDVKYSSEIIFKDSLYNDSYKVFSVTNNTFNVCLNKVPEQLTYNPDVVKKFEYYTNSKRATGGVKNVFLTFGGANYKKLPIFKKFESSKGRGAFITPFSSNIGRLNNVRILDPGFEYASDKTLRPEAYMSPFISLSNAQQVKSVRVISGGNNYTSAPNLVLVDPSTRKVVDNGIINAKITSNAISDIVIIIPPKGLNSDVYELFTVDNSNGVPIDTIIPSPNSGIVTCFLTTPILDFDNPPFAIGDKIFVEGIQKSYTDGEGYNSSDYGYEFFEVTNYVNTNPARLEYALPPGKTNPGMAFTSQSSYATIVNKNIYPVFDVNQEFSKFTANEKLLVFDFKRASYVEKDLYVASIDKETLKVYGSYELKIGDKLLGKNTGSLIAIKDLNKNLGIFNVSYSIKKEYGWITNTGILNQDYQVLPDNDYYQTLSYTIKSPIDYDTLKTPVNSLLHTSGLKNFADLGITSTAKISLGSTVVTSTNVVDIINENRVDTINNIDLVKDTKTFQNKSKFIYLRGKRLSSYIECRKNRALSIDDISPLFSSKENSSTKFLDVLTFATKEDYSRLLIQIIDPASLDRQITELVIIKDNKNLFTLQKQSLSNVYVLPQSYREVNSLGTIEGNLNNDTGTLSLRFYPNDPLNVDYDIKVLRIKTDTSLPGVGTYRMGSVNLIGFNTSTTGIHSTTPIVKVGVSSLSSLFANFQVVDNVTQEKTLVELYLNHDGTNTYMSQYFMDTDEANGPFSGNFIGSFTSEIKSGILYLNYNSYIDKSNSITIKSEIIGFGATQGGVDHYTFRAPGQPEGAARSARLETSYSKVSGISTVLLFDKTLYTSVKSYVRVETDNNNTSALHQVLLIHDGNDIYTTQYANLSIGCTNGIGTFGGVYDGSNVVLKFYPDSQYTGVISIQSYNEMIYEYIDIGNEPDDLAFGTLRQSFHLSQYNAINGNRINKTSFTLKSNGTPIFMKEFNPSDSSVLNPTTGLIRIQNHYFSNLERLIYRPYSAFIGIAASSVGIGATLDSAGIVTTILPSEVYVIKIDNNNIKLSTRRDYAISGIAVTFTSLGSGTNHQLEMYKKNEKSLISIDGVIQYPLAYTPINQTLSDNIGGKLGIGVTYISLSGISSVYVDDVLKINEEYVKVISVGLGTTASGPITGIGSVNLVWVERAVLGSGQTTHNDSSIARVYSGTYNIVGKNVHFVTAPKGDTSRTKNQSNLLDPRSSFNGRVFLKSDYTNARIFDDTSRTFDGQSQYYRMTIQGINTVGIDTGSGILLINDVFQTPTTPNNVNNNYSFSEISGISSVVFSGITSNNGTLIKSLYDINQNQLPRGGVIVSLGSSTGVGYAPLVGAAVTAIVGAGGSIKAVGVTTFDVSGSGYRGNVSVAITETGHTGIGATISAIVGAGGTLSFQVIGGGSEYINPTIQVRYPNYSNLPITGVFRRGIGQTTECGTGLLLNLEVGSSQTDLRPISGRNADAANLISFNKQLIAEVAVGRMLANYPGFSVPGGNSKCIRDIISILDCIIYNLKYGGNSNVYDAARLYIDNGYLSGEEQQSIYAFMQARDMAIQAMRNQAISRDGYTTLTQYYDNTVIGDISGLPGVYNSGDCADIASAIGSFVGIVTFAIRDNTINVSRNGISTSFFEVTKFEIARQGYGFKIGDIFKPVGLVTDGRLASPLQDFELTVLDVFNDNFAYWQFGELDYIDSIESLQDGVTTRFPLLYEGNALSFETNKRDPDSMEIDLASILVIIVNGVIQEPHKSYIFDGGTSFSFTTPPRKEDKVSIFFYRGSRTDDSVLLSDLPETIKVGDTVQINKNNSIPNTLTQDGRTVHRIAFSDVIETNTYTGVGIDEINYKPISWTKQKSDRVIDGKIVSKSRDSIESLVYPAGRIIKNITASSNEIFVDNANFFNYEENVSEFEDIINLGAILIDDKQPVAAAATAVVSSTGTIESLSIVNGGSGYSYSGTGFNYAKPVRVVSLNSSVGIAFTDRAILASSTRGTGQQIYDYIWDNYNQFDIDGDGVISAVDGLILYQYLVGTAFRGNNLINNINFPYSAVRKDHISIRKNISKYVKNTDSSSVNVGIRTTIITGITTYTAFGFSNVENAGWLLGEETSVGVSSFIDSGTTIVSIGISQITLNKPTLNATALTGVGITFGNGLYDIDGDDNISQLGDGLLLTRFGSSVAPASKLSVDNVVNLKIAAPYRLGVGIGTIATGIASVMIDGTLGNPSVTNAGFGYDQTNPPNVIAPYPNFSIETIKDINTVEGFAGIVTGISTTNGTSGNPLALKFYLKTQELTFDGLEQGYPIYIFDTTVGRGITSIDTTSNSIVGIGTTYLDNIYYIHSISKFGNTAEIVTNVKQDSSITGIATLGITTVGRFSWGRFYNFSRSDYPISIAVTGYTVSSGLSTFPSIQRRNYGLRKNGSLKKTIKLTNE